MNRSVRPGSPEAMVCSIDDEKKVEPLVLDLDPQRAMP